MLYIVLNNDIYLQMNQGVFDDKQIHLDDEPVPFDR